MNLNTTHPNVPTERAPLWWNLDAPHQSNLDRMDRWIAHYDYALPLGHSIDEVAVQTMDPGRMSDYLNRNEWEQFNDARDVVYTNPFGTRYSVSYRFFRHSAVRYRMEVMTMNDGFSPLHQSLWEQTTRMRGDNLDLLPVPHLSFKPNFLSPITEGPLPARRQYGKVVNHLVSKACLLAQACQSTYGVFGYFIGNETARQVYLKPRVNLRDQA